MSSIVLVCLIVVLAVVVTLWISTVYHRISSCSAVSVISDNLCMNLSYKGHRFPPEIISHAVWRYHRFTLSLRYLEELLAERGIIIEEALFHQDFSRTNSKCFWVVSTVEIYG